jgi:hypothetical protein
MGKGVGHALPPAGKDHADAAKSANQTSNAPFRQASARFERFLHYHTLRNG